nr:hypothetical protein [Tanacetum cinerariifolium]
MAGLLFRMFKVDKIEVRGPIHGVEEQLGMGEFRTELGMLIQAPTTQTMFMANLSSADHVYDDAGPSYGLDILSKYVKDHGMPGVHSNVSSVPNDAYMMIYNDMYESHAQFVSKTSWNTVVENSLTAELATYKEQVELYERRA